MDLMDQESILFVANKKSSKLGFEFWFGLKRKDERMERKFSHGEGEIVARAAQRGDLHLSIYFYFITLNKNKISILIPNM